MTIKKNRQPRATSSSPQKVNELTSQVVKHFRLVDRNEMPDDLSPDDSQAREVFYGDDDLLPSGEKFDPDHPFIGSPIEIELDMDHDALEKLIDRGLKEQVTAPYDPLLESVVYEYKKSRSLIKASGQLSAGARNMQNALYCGSLKNPRAEMHEISFKELFHLMGWKADGGHNRKQIIYYLSCLQQTFLVLNSEDGLGNYAKTGLISDFAIQSDRIVYSFNRITARLISDPLFAATIDLRSQYSSRYSGALMELCLSYLPEGQTPEWTVDVWRSYFNIEKDTHKEFRYLNARVFQPAIKEILKTSGFVVTMEPIKQGKKIVRVRFSIVQSHAGQIQTTLQAKNHPAFEKLKRLGVTAVMAIECILEDPVRANDIADYTLKKFMDGTVESTGPYALKLIKEKASPISQVEKEAQAKKAKKTQEPKIREADKKAIRTARSNLIRRAVDEYIAKQTPDGVVEMCKVIAMNPATTQTIRTRLMGLAKEAILPEAEIDKGILAKICEDHYFRGNIYTKLDPKNEKCMQTLSRRYGARNVRAALDEA